MHTPWCEFPVGVSSSKCRDSGNAAEQLFRWTEIYIQPRRCKPRTTSQPLSGFCRLLSLHQVLPAWLLPQHQHLESALSHVSLWCFPVWLLVMMALSGLWCQLNEIVNSKMIDRCLLFVLISVLNSAEQVASHRPLVGVQIAPASLVGGSVDFLVWGKRYTAMIRQSST